MPKRLRLPKRRTPWVVVVIVVLLAAGRLFQSQQQADTPDVLSEGECTVERVVDGDTLKLTDGARVRLVGVNTPELARDGKPAEPFAEEAKMFAEQFVNGKRVTLRFDLERQDRYGRFLAYVLVNDQSLGESLLKAGLAEAGNYRYSDSVKRRYRKLEAEAREAGRGMWGEQ